LDTIFLHGLKVDCVIGVWDWERRIKQRVEIDIDMAADIQRAAASDRLEDTLNYKAIAKAVIAHVESSEYKLVETLAESIAHILTEDFGMPWCRVRLNKGGAVRGARAVGVIIERSAVADASPP
jgi:dihydroneopterin aldolase